MANEESISTNWRIPFEAAKGESNLRQLSTRITEAEDAMFFRLQELKDGDVAERNDIQSAVRTIREWQVSKLNFPRLNNE